MNQSELIEKIHEKIIVNNLNLSKHQTNEIFNFMIEILKDAMKNSHRIELRGLGSFAPRMRLSRLARNPKTNQSVSLDERLAIYFRAGKLLLKSLNT